MGPSERSDLLLGWNLDPSEGHSPGRSEVLRGWHEAPRPARGRPRSRDGAQAPGGPSRGLSGSVELALNFTIHPDLAPSSEFEIPAGETVAMPDADGTRARDPIPFPRCGEGIGGFRLVSELGRGAFGRVYLAEEAGLGNRPVALKITRPEGEEPRLLARLQHTHIVPIHSVADDPETGLRLMCMPYFGGANLARVLEATGHRLPSGVTGLSLIQALDSVASPDPGFDPGFEPDDSPGSRSRDARDLGPGPVGAPAEGLAGSSAPIRSILGKIPWWSKSLSKPPAPAVDHDPAQPARRFLRESSFVRASAWIAARLAEGLDHAHSRGLLHRDLKPSNILIAADGTPMLLDFNLAADCISADEADRAMVGGTLPYMAPEHLDAFNPNGSTRPESVGERADIYALGLILFEMLAGRHPFPDPPAGRPMLEAVAIMTEERRGPVPSLRARNPDVPRSLEAIVRKCLDPDPDRRHARAGDLAEDLRRFLDDRPLKYAPEPSLVERAAKWARRNPKVTGATPVALISMALILAIGGAAWTLSRHIHQVSARLKVRRFERTFLECQFLLNIANGPPKDLGRGIGLAEEAIREAGVGPDGDIPRSWVALLSTEEQAAMRGDLAELILLSSRARVYQAERSRSEEKRRRALERGVAELDRAERLDPKPPQALFAERARYHAALGEADEAARDRDLAARTPPTTGRDFYLLGTFLLADGQPDRAEAALARAVGLDPRRFWSWFSLGLCHFDQGRFPESAGDFAVCAVLAPRFSWPWLNRGLALARAGRLVEAREAYDRAVEADGRNAEALIHRGLARMELGDPRAIDDLQGAVDLGRGDPSARRDPSVFAALAESMVRADRRAEGLLLLDELVESEPSSPAPRAVRGMLRLDGDPRLAEADFRHVLDADPGQPVANLGMARLLRVDDPSASLAYVERTLAGDPSRVDALELRAWLRGRLGDPLAVADVDLLIRTPTPHRLYNSACALALLSESRPDPGLTARAIDLLRRAIEAGFPADALRDDPDLKSLRDDPAIRKWLEAPRPKDKDKSKAA